MKYILLKTEFYSPYTSVQFFAEHGSGSIVPPPSTLIGALAAVYYYPVEREIEDEFVSKVKYVTFHVPPYTVVENISRHFTLFSQRKERLKALRAAIDVVTGARELDAAVLKIFTNYGGLRLKKNESVEKAFQRMRSSGMTDVDIALTAVQVLLAPATRTETYFWEPAYILYVVDDELKIEPTGIMRIGPKESIVSVTELKIKNLQRINERIRTRFYVPVRALEGMCGTCNVIYMAQRPGGDPDKAGVEPYYVPRSAPDMSIEGSPAHGWAAVEIEAEDVTLRAIVPEYVAP
jgi:CRISPR-associated protein Cas5a/b/c